MPAVEDDDGTTLPSFVDEGQYQQMKLPDRAVSENHVIFGQLLQKDLVESYAVYRHTGSSSSISSADNEPVVVAVVQLGGSLDGHTGIVHGEYCGKHLIDDNMRFCKASKTKLTISCFCRWYPCPAD
jgi:hypothetical protein